VDAQRRVAPIEQVPLGPRLDREDGGEQVEPGLGKTVLVPVRVGAVAHSFKESVFHERCQARSEHIASDTEVALEVPVAADAEERLA